MLSRKEEFQRLETRILQYDHALQSGKLDAAKVESAQRLLDQLAQKYLHDPSVGREKFRLYEMQALIELSRGEYVRAETFIVESRQMMTKQDHFLASAVNNYVSRVSDQAHAKVEQGEPIGGWLSLYALYLLFTPFWIVYDLVGILPNYNDILAAMSSSNEFSTYFAAACSIDLLQLVMAIIMCYLFFSRKIVARRVMPVYLSAVAITYMIFAIWTNNIYQLFAITGQNPYIIKLGSVAFGAGIWLLYWLLSKRVVRTFVRL